MSEEEMQYVEVVANMDEDERTEYEIMDDIAHPEERENLRDIGEEEIGLVVRYSIVDWGVKEENGDVVRFYGQASVRRPVDFKLFIETNIVEISRGLLEAEGVENIINMIKSKLIHRLIRKMFGEV